MVPRQKIDHSLDIAGLEHTCLHGHVVTPVTETLGRSPATALKTAAEAIRGALLGIGGDAWVALAPLHAERKTLQATAREAEACLGLAMVMFPEPTAFTLDETMPWLALAANADVTRRLAAIVDEIVELDRRKQTNLVVTLTALFQSASMSEAARKLGIHRHTLEHRVNTAERVLQLDIRRSPDRFLIEAALISRRLGAHHEA